MISRSVAQIATASMRTNTSARAGTGVGLSRRNSSSGPPSTQAFIRSGIGNWADVLTPAGSYMAAFSQDCRRLDVAPEILLAVILTALTTAAIAFSAIAKDRTSIGLRCRQFVDFKRVRFRASLRFGDPEQ